VSLDFDFQMVKGGIGKTALESRRNFGILQVLGRGIHGCDCRTTEPRWFPVNTEVWL